MNGMRVSNTAQNTMSMRASSPINGEQGDEQESAPLDSGGNQGEEEPGGRAAQIESGKKAQLETLRQLRAKVQGMAEILLLIRERKTTVKEQATYLKKVAGDLATYQLALRGDDTIQRILNILDQMASCPLLVTPETELSAEEQSKQLDLVAEHIRKLEYWVGYSTIPERVNRWLENQRPGYYLPFHEVFADEVPNADDRIKLLNALAWSPEEIDGGMVVANQGLIYRYAKTNQDRGWTFVWLIVASVLALLSVVGIAYLYTSMLAPAIGADGAVVRQAAGAMVPRFLVAWLALIVGIVVHVAVDVAKGRNNSKLPAVFAINDAALMLNARSGEIIWKLVLSVIALGGVVFTLGVDSGLFANAFLVGYSLDSFIGLFGSISERNATALQSKF